MGNLVKTVELRILASAGDAQAQLDDLTAKADKLDGDAIRMRFRLDDAEGKAQLDAIKARADELGFKDVSIKVKVDGAGKAIADLLAVKHEEDKARDGGLMSRLGGLWGSVVEGAGNLPFVGGVAGAGNGAGLAAIAAGAAALLPELTGLVSGFAAAGAGAGAFYVLAHPAINNLQADVAGLNSANQALGIAQQKYLIDPTKQNAKDLKNAQVTYQATFQQMGADAGPAAAQVLKLHDAYAKVTTAFQPQAFRIIGDSLKVVTNALPALMPLANGFANALDPLLKKLAGFTASKGFGDFIKQFSALTGPAVTAIGDGIGKVAGSIGKLLTTMSGKDVAQAIGIAFNTVAGIISGLAAVVHGLMGAWDSMSSTAKQDAHEVAAAFDSMRHGVASAIGSVISTAESLPGKIKGVYAGALGWLKQAGIDIVEGLIKGIGSMVGAAVSAAAHVGSSVVGAITSFLGIHSPSTVMHAIGQQTIMGLVTGILSQVPVLGSAAAKAGAAIRSAITTEVAYAKSVASAAVSGLSLTSINLTTDTVTSGMQSYLATLKSFTADIKALSAQHLNKTLLQQLITAGPVTGDQYAQSILQGGGAAQVNALYKQISQQSALLGAQSAMAMYGNKVTPGAGGNFTVVVNVTAPSGKTGQALGQAQGQALALEIIKLLKEYKRHGGGAPLGIA